ncbi:RHS repeat-associated core domain protein [Capnocytophaga ochracea F0287]|uniref:RHS repeat-associated core domain protein n=2 Tax=Capnocytophaga ochracea TaxID=1018 RepID=E4MRB8_CAPOC|nr:RHS repeat-associated core domain-containing protein [Capnocytophaga ochracea]EFS97773.1 RHS repeat-associated core domain protein [Capnocytophaga ochracea F0287]UEB43922.1 RHS repeat-associated core domain-containing protein [Capnocytophaga ochracea]
MLWGNITNYWNAEGATTIPAEGILLDRGYTGHEHLQTVGLVHMNGRLYDPVLHRFLQPDNFVQDPFNTQNFNRYGYCLNNPLVYVDENGEFIITAFIVGAIIGAYIGGSQANGTYNPFKWDFNNVETWGGIVGGGIIGYLSGGVAAYAGGLAAAGLAAYGITGGVIGGAVVGATSGLVGGAVIGGATGALTTPKGHNIWTGREIQQPVQTLEGAPINIHLDAENNITGNLELNAPTTNSVALDVQQPKLIPIETPDGGIKLISQFSESSIDKGVRLTMSQKELHIFANKLHPKPWLNDLSTKMGGNQNVIESILRNVSGKIQPNTSGVFQVSTTIDGIQIYVRGYINQGVPIINTVYIPK